MEITGWPAPYQGAFREVVYTLAAEEGEEIPDVQIYGGAVGSGGFPETDNEGELGIKRFAGMKGCRVNAAGYLWRFLGVAPLSGDGGVTEELNGRLVWSRIQAGTEISPVGLLTAGMKDALPCRRLSDAPQVCELLPGGWDEIAWVSPGSTAEVILTMEDVLGQSLVLDYGQVECGDGMYAFSLAYDEVKKRVAEAGKDMGMFRTLEVSVGFRGTDDAVAGDVIRQEYRLMDEGADSIHVCWLNAWGAVDHYSFPKCAGEQFRIEKERVSIPEGIRTVGARLRREWALTSRYEPRRTMAWLSMLAASPKVWLMDGDRWMPVNLTSECVQVRQTGGLCRLEAMVSPVKECEFQRG